ncbi:MAG: response regulator transcription factor [Oscillospiraceae bacterium]|jgi:DNA-binding response OmpR family regulator|nr:response regulator transcription factor [Oscillospiraceae bacterium]
MKRILVAEDESTIREFIVLNLERAGYEVTEVNDGKVALRKYEDESKNFDIAILDIMMPVLNGLDVCKELRKKSSNIGIILLTAKTQEIDKISGLMFGADDYMTKPFSPSELVARVDALYRRVAIAQMRADNNFKEEICLGEFKLNLRSHMLFKRDEAIDLTHVEFRMIEFFFSNVGTALSRSEISEHVWGKTRLGDEKIVDVNIRRLRMKIEDDPSNCKYILTVWGFGYKWSS